MSNNPQPQPIWRKSSRSGGGGGGCVEVATNLASTSGVVHVRDTKDHGQGPILTVPTNAWRAFTDVIRAGAFNL